MRGVSSADTPSDFEAIVADLVVVQVVTQRALRVRVPRCTRQSSIGQAAARHGNCSGADGTVTSGDSAAPIQQDTREPIRVGQAPMLSYSSMRRRPVELSTVLTGRKDWRRRSK